MQVLPLLPELPNLYLLQNQPHVAPQQVSCGSRHLRGNKVNPQKSSLLGLTDHLSGQERVLVPELCPQLQVQVSARARLIRAKARPCWQLTERLRAPGRKVPSATLPTPNPLPEEYRDAERQLGGRGGSSAAPPFREITPPSPASLNLRQAQSRA